MSERLHTVAATLAEAFPGWHAVPEGNLRVVLTCAEPDCGTVFACRRPLSNGAKNVLELHRFTHSPDYVPDVKRVK